MLPDKVLLWPAGENPTDCLALVCSVMSFPACVDLALKPLLTVLRPFSMVFQVVTHPAVLSCQSCQFVLPMLYEGLPILHSARGAIVLERLLWCGGVVRLAQDERQFSQTTNGVALLVAYGYHPLILSSSHHCETPKNSAMAFFIESRHAARPSRLLGYFL